MRIYIPIKEKFLFVLFFSFLWSSVSIYFSLDWLSDLSKHLGYFFSVFLIFYIAIIPGFMNSFLLMSLLIDNRPIVRSFNSFPDITVLIAAYNEESSIKETILSIFAQEYSGLINIIVINDGSTDKTAFVIEELIKLYANLKLINQPKNCGKATAINLGLANSSADLIITIDADCWIKPNGIRRIVSRYLSDPPNTKAVAGAVFIKNSRESWISKAQEWDYFLGIASIKRAQSLFQGTLVAQGAFSIYDRVTLVEVGGWSDTVGEDIVLTWKLLKAGYRVGYAEDACAFTRCPSTVYQFIKQRQRWSRGMIEAFKDNMRLLVKPRYSLFYIVCNTQFPLMDLAYTIGFLPGIVLACFGHFWIVGPMTLSLIPSAMLLNFIMYRACKRMFEHESISIRGNLVGFLSYVFLYSLILQPACIWGYFSEVFKFKKTWGTK